MKHMLSVLKSAPRAGQKASAGQIWPAGRTLPTPELLSHCHKILIEGLKA